MSSTPAPTPPQAAPRPDDPLRGILLILGAVLLFSIADAMAKHLSQSLPPLEVVWLRYLVFFPLALLALARRGGSKLLRPRMPRMQFLRGVGVAGSALAFTAALQVLPLAEATAINFVSPAFITVLAVIFLGETVGWRRWTAIGVGLLGVLIVVRPGSAIFQPAAILPVLTAASWATAVIATRRMAGADSSATTLIWTAGIGFAIFTLLLPFVFVMPTSGEFGFGLLIGLVSSIPHMLVVLAYRHAPASVLAPFSYTQIVTSTLIGFLFFSAAPDVWTMVGAAVIAASGLYSAHRERVRSRERTRPAAQ